MILELILGCVYVDLAIFKGYRRENGVLTNLGVFRNPLVRMLVLVRSRADTMVTAHRIRRHFMSLKLK